jgi:hypothetical protein
VVLLGLMRVSASALLAFVVLLTSACDRGSEPQAATARAVGVGGTEATFRACAVPSGGYRVRAIGLPCSAARDVVQHFRAIRQLREFRFRDPDDSQQVSREVVWRARGGWTCLAQALPRVRSNQFLCARGEQVVLWGVA